METNPMTPKHYIALRSSDNKIVMPDVPEEPRFIGPQFWEPYHEAVKKAIANAPEFKDQQVAFKILFRQYGNDDIKFSDKIVKDKPYVVDLSEYAVSIFELGRFVILTKKQPDMTPKQELKQDDFPNYQAYRLALDKQDSACVHMYSRSISEPRLRKCIHCGETDLKGVSTQDIPKEFAETINKKWDKLMEDSAHTEGNNETYNCESCGVPLIRKENAVVETGLLCHLCWKSGQTDWEKESDKHLETADLNTLREIIKKQANSISYWRKEFYKTQLSPVNPLPTEGQTTEALRKEVAWRFTNGHGGLDEDRLIDWVRGVEVSKGQSETQEVPVSELKQFLNWVLLEADRIYVEHTLGWRDEAIKEMYEAYKRSISRKQK